MATSAVISKKTKIEIKVGNAFVKIGGFLNFSGLGGGSAAVIEATDLDSDAKEKLMGLPDEGSIKLDFNFFENDAGQTALVAARGTQALTSFKLTLNNKKVYAFDGYVMTAEPGAGVDKTITLSAGVEISGAAVLSTVTP